MTTPRTTTPPSPDPTLLTEPASDESKARLSGAKLTALVRSHGHEPGPPAAFGAGAALLAGHDAWVLVDGDSSRSLGPALAWAERSSAAALSVVADEGAEVLARRAGLFTTSITILRVEGSDLVPVEPAADQVVDAPPDDPEHAAELRGADLEVTVEHGRLLGEYLGLEVARVERGASGNDLQVGVGRFDREMTAEVHQGLPPHAALRRVAEIVNEIRRSDHPPHPLRDMAPERWLRHRLVRAPELAGCAELVPVPSPFARQNLLERSTAAATGRDTSGRDVVVVTSVGIDLDLVPTAADTRAHLDSRARLMIVVPERDRHPLTETIASQVSDGCDLITVTDDWRRP